MGVPSGLLAVWEPEASPSPAGASIPRVSGASVALWAGRWIPPAWRGTTCPMRGEPMMNRWLLMGVLSLLLVPLSALPAAGPRREERTLSPAVPLPAETAPVEEAFRQAVQLWAKGQFDALWARGLLESRYQVSKEAFIRWMRQRTITPTCCWGQIRAATVHLRRPEDALVEATLGVDVKTLGATVERTVLFHLRWEEGEWRVALEDFMFKPG